MLAPLDELSVEASVDNTAAIHLVHAMAEERVAVRDEDQRFLPGYKLFEFSSLALEQFDIRKLAHLHVAELNDRTGHTVHLAAVEGNEPVYFDKFESHDLACRFSNYGLTAALHLTAVSTTLRADMWRSAQEKIAELLDDVEHIENTPTSPEALHARLANVRLQGWAHASAEHEAFVQGIIACIALPYNSMPGQIW